MIKVRLADWNDEDDRKALSSVRRNVFIEEQHVPEELEWDGDDADAIHVLACDDNTPIGSARLKKDGQIGRMAVMKTFRSRGIGKKIMEQLLVAARENHIEPLWLSAQTHAASFYRPYGFTMVGEEYMDAGIPHILMEQT